MKSAAGKKVGMLFKFSPFRSNASGAVAIEFALILPILLLFIVGIIDFGHWFFLEQIAQRATSNAAVAIQRDQTQSYGQVNASAGLGVVNMGSGGNFICALAAQDAPSAEAAAYGCGGNAWGIGNPTGNPSTPYYVGVSSHIAYVPLIPLSTTWPPRNIFARTMVRVNPATAIPTCNANQYLTANGTGFTCRDVPECTENEYLAIDSTGFVCKSKNDCIYGNVRVANHTACVVGAYATGSAPSSLCATGQATFFTRDFYRCENGGFLPKGEENGYFCSQDDRGGRDLGTGYATGALLSQNGTFPVMNTCY